MLLTRLRVTALSRMALAGIALVAGLALIDGAAHGVTPSTMPRVTTTTIDGPITPVIRDHLDDTVQIAASEGDRAVVIFLNTPGGGLDVTRDIANTLLGAPLPVIVYVAPSGADAGSAGTFIAYAAHITYMAPATTIGAATPVDLEGGEVGDKIVENTLAFGRALAEFRGRDVGFIEDAVRDGASVTASVALERGAIDGITSTLSELLDDVDGATLAVGDDTVTLHTQGASVIAREMTGVRNLLQILANPNLAFIFMSLGTLAIIYEVANPGMGLGGVAGVIMLVLALFSLAVLPVSYAGAALLVVAVALFVAELFAPGIGVGAAGGTAALILGGLFLFQAETGLGVDLWVLIPTALVMGGLVVFAGIMVAQTRGKPSLAASDYLTGRESLVHHVDHRSAFARFDGVQWRVRPSETQVQLAIGDHVRVMNRDNLTLVVEKVSDDEQPHAAVNNEAKETS